MSTVQRFTSADLLAFPDNDGKRYEIIDGELYVSKQPHAFRQLVCSRLIVTLARWSQQSDGGHAFVAPGLIFADDDDVAPDVAWVSDRQLPLILQPDGKLHGAPELVAEVLSPGPTNENRDRNAKLNLYSRRGVEEYWIVDWQRRRVEVFRRQDARLVLTVTLEESDPLTSPLFPDCSCLVAELFAGIPPR